MKFNTMDHCIIHSKYSSSHISACEKCIKGHKCKYVKCKQIICNKNNSYYCRDQRSLSGNLRLLL